MQQRQNRSAALLDVDESILTNRLRLQADDGVGTYDRQELSQLVPDSKLASAITISPDPGMCVKTKLLSGTQSKVFVNVCTSGSIPPPEDLTEDELLEILNSDEPSNFRIPLSIGELHEEQDKKGNACSAYDVVMNPEFLAKARDSLIFNNFVVLAILEALEVKYTIELDKNGWTILKNKLYLGILKERSVRVSVPLVQELSGLRPAPKPSNDSAPTAPLLTELSSRSLQPDSTDDNKAKAVKKGISSNVSSLENLSPTRESKHARQLTPVETKRLSSDHVKNQKRKPKYELERILSDNAVGPKEMIGIAVRVLLPGQVRGADISVLMGDDSLVVETPSFFLEQSLPSAVQCDQARTFFIKEKQALLVQAPLLAVA